MRATASDLRIISAGLWRELLVGYARPYMSSTGVWVDLGAGPESLVAREIGGQREAFWLAIDPNFDPAPVPGGAAIRGTLACVGSETVDCILFNPPVLPPFLLDPGHPDLALFHGGGDNGCGVLGSALPDAYTCLRKQGCLVIVWPSFHPPLPRQPLAAELLGYGHEKVGQFALRSPLRRGGLHDFRTWLSARQEYYQGSWSDIGVEPLSESFALSVWRLRKGP